MGIVYTHRKHNDTALFRDENGNICLYYNDDGVIESYTFGLFQEELFEMLGEYYDDEKHQDIFDELTIHAQDALWNGLYWLNERNLEV